MAFDGGISNVELSQGLIESLQVDFKNLASESKKKYPQVKEVNIENVLALLLLFIYYLFFILP